MTRDESQFKAILSDFAAAEACANALAKALTESESELAAAIEVSPILALYTLNKEKWYV